MIAVFTTTLALINSVFCGGLAGTVLRLRPRSLSQWSFIIGMIVLGAESAFGGLSYQSITPNRAVYWQQFRLLAAAFVPGPWLVFSLCYSRGNYREFLGRWWLTIFLAFVLPPWLALGFPEQLVTGVAWRGLSETASFELGQAGVALNLSCLLGAVLILTNLERTFRASVGTMRWRIKYMMLGLAVVFGMNIYLGSQVLLSSAIGLSLATLEAIGLLVGCSLLSLSLFRSRLTNVDVYPSHAVLHRSLTVLLAGSYLLVVGVLAKIVMTLGGNAAFPFEALLILAGLVGVTVLLLSDRVRQKTKGFVSRHFHRPSYDYRKVWSAFTEKTTSLIDEAGLCRAVVRLIAENFELLSVTAWRVSDDKQTLFLAASTALSESKAGEQTTSFDNFAQLIQSMAAHPYPADPDASAESWAKTLKRYNPDNFSRSSQRLYVPLVSGGELLGLIALGDRVNNAKFSTEELDLLKCIGDQIAASLRNIKLARMLVEAREMEAFQTMSAFFVHDLKNTASTLSLLLQNMAAHFEDPAFREDAARALSKSVTHINSLVGELGLLRQRLEIKTVEADLNQVTTAALLALDGTPNILVTRNYAPLPKILLDPQQIRKVITNLLINAREAVDEHGEIRVETSQRDGWAILSVADNGCGISPEFITHSLFKPFQTTKKKGLGIGMFHSKMIVDAHGGRFEVASEKGKGSVFRVLLPLPPPVA